MPSTANECVRCGGEVNPRRFSLGYETCLTCGEYQARQVKHCVAPLHKSNYMVFTNKEDLKGINNKGGIVR
jgi:recombinational DNA repair protein (RecF pathway)